MPGKSGRSIRVLEITPPSSFQLKIERQENLWWKSYFVPLNGHRERPMLEKSCSIQRMD
jgi:hypothetical protein